MKKFISMLASSVMLFSVLPTGVSAEKVFTLDEPDQAYIDYMNLSDEEKSQTLKPLPYNIEPFLPVGISLFSMLPSRYDMREEGLLPDVENQGPFGICWTYASNGALESHLLQKYSERYDFSENHIAYSTSYSSFTNGVNTRGIQGRRATDGGNILTYATYAFSGMGPVAESEMPYTGTMENKYLADIYDKPLAGPQLRDFYRLTDKTDISESEEMTLLKNHIHEYGALSVGVLIETSLSSAYYNSTHCAYYQPSASNPNHAVMIVGWDDNFSKDNFNSAYRPEGDGAWIIQNSWGDNVQENGYYYMSYYQPVYTPTVIEEASLTHDYDNLYYVTKTQDDFSTVSGITYVANVFTKSPGAQKLTDVTLCTTEAVSYKVYVNPNASGDILPDSVRENCYAEGIIEHFGFSTIELDMPVTISAEKFAVIVEYTSIGTGGAPTNIIYTTGAGNTSIGSISSNGNDWHSLLGTSSGDTTGFDCGIYAYTTDLVSKAEVKFNKSPYYLTSPLKFTNGTNTYKMKQGGVFSLLPGSYTFTSRASGYIDKTTTFNITSDDLGQQKTVDVFALKTPYTMDLSIENAAGTIVTSLSTAQTLTIKPTVLPSTTFDTEDVLIVSIYNSHGALENLYSVPCSVLTLSEGSYTTQISSTIAPGDTVKAFVWEGVDSLKTVSETATVTITKE